MKQDERIGKLRHGYYLFKDTMIVAEQEEWSAEELMWYITEMCDFILEYDRRNREKMNESN